MNVLELVDGLLADWVSPRTRRLIHALLALALYVVTVVTAAGGDWQVALGTLAVAIYATMNKANTPATPIEPPGFDAVPANDLPYTEAGGNPYPSESLYGQEEPIYGLADSSLERDPHRP